MPAYLPSELPVMGYARRHWIVMFRWRPHPILLGALLLLLVSAVLSPTLMAPLLGLIVLAVAFVRWQTWRAQRVILTRSRIIRVTGVPETTSTEASLRLDRISGAVLEQTVLGKMLNYGSIQLEAPGQHPDLRHLTFIARPHAFYLQIRRVIFSDGSDIDASRPQDLLTAPLPRLGRRRSGLG